MKTKRLKKLLMALGTPRNNAEKAIDVCHGIKGISSNSDIFRFAGALIVDSHMMRDIAQSMYLEYLAGDESAGEFVHRMGKLNNAVRCAKKWMI